MIRLPQRLWAWLSLVGLGYGLILSISGIWAEKAIFGNSLPPFEISPLYPYLDYAVAPESLLAVSLFGCFLVYRRLWKDAILVPVFSSVAYDAYWTLLRYWSGLKPAPIFVAQLPIFWAVAIFSIYFLYRDRTNVKGLAWFASVGMYILLSQLYFPSLDTRAPLEIAVCLSTCVLFKVPIFPTFTAYRKAYVKKFLHAHWILAISAPVNYLVVIFLVVDLRYVGYWIIGPVMIGDIVGDLVNWTLAEKTKLFEIKQ
jgi:hypothetical protein